MDDIKNCLKVKDCCVTLDGKIILDIVSLECKPSEWVLVYGKTGSGKSTLLRAINGLCPISSGQIWVLGSCMPGRSEREARLTWLRTGTVLQQVALFETYTVVENIALPLKAAGVSQKTALDQAMQWLEHFGLGSKAKEYPPHLSGGESQQVALARAFVINPSLLILDEPTSALDKTSAHRLLQTLKEFTKKGTIVLMTSHHRMSEIQELCDQKFELRGGKLYNR